MVNVSSSRQTERVVALPVGSPKIVALSGSTRFTAAFAKAQNEFTLMGYIVLSVGSVTRSDDELFASMTPDERRLLKARLDVLHQHKVALADEVYVLDVGGYIGDSTLQEIEWAKSLNKRIRYLSEEQGESHG